MAPGEDDDIKLCVGGGEKGSCQRFLALLPCLEYVGPLHKLLLSSMLSYL